MPVRRVLPAVLTAAALLLTGCGSTEDAPAAAAAVETPVASASPSAKAGKIARTAEPKRPRAAARASVAPEVVLPSTSDTRSQAALSGWQGTVIAQLRRIDPRLVTRQAAVISKVRATCDQMSTGMFETKVLPIIVQRFSNAKIKVTEEMAQGIYAVLLQDACYVMNS